MVDVVELDTARQRMREDPKLKQTDLGKRLDGKIDRVGETAEVAPFLEPCGRAAQHGGALLDHKRIGIPEGSTREVRPMACPPRTKRVDRNVLVSLMASEVDSFALELKHWLNRVCDRSDNRSDAIPILRLMYALTIEWLPDIRKGRARMFVSHCMLLERELSLALEFVDEHWGARSAEAQGIKLLLSRAEFWTKRLRDTD